MDITFPEELGVKIPRLGEAEQEDPMVWLKLTCEQAGWTWYIIEMQPHEQDAMFYGYIAAWGEALTHFNQSDLELQSAQWGFPIVCDEAFVPCRLSEVRTVEWSDRKFLLGQIVATPGAADALTRNSQEPTEFLRRHWRGNWGELDEEDVQENEFSLARGFRLLSRYILKDGTIIYIITDADRSVTTLLLPEEY